MSIIVRIVITICSTICLKVTTVFQQIHIFITQYYHPKTMRLLTTDNLKQIGLISLILIVGLNILKEFSTFVPGVLGAATMYILMRTKFVQLVKKYKWKKWIIATLFIIVAIIVFVLPAVLMFQAILPKLNNFISNTSNLASILESISESFKRMGIPITMDEERISSIVSEITSSVPVVLGATANMLTNSVLAFFFLYFMLVQGEQMEQAIQKYLPLKETNVDDIWHSTKLVVNANAIGIPLLAACQGVVAIIGYKIFGVQSFIFLGILTGIFSVVPIVGCALVWVPICIHLTISGHEGQALGLAIYSFVVTGGIDNVLRFTILKKLGDVHPIITTIGIIVGVPMFGFMGFIFGPLLVSYFLLLVKIYRVEFANDKFQKGKEII